MLWNYSLIEEHQYTLNIYMVEQRGGKSNHFEVDLKRISNIKCDWLILRKTTNLWDLIMDYTLNTYSEPKQHIILADKHLLFFIWVLATIRKIKQKIIM